MFSWIIGLILGDLPSWIWPALAGGGFAIYFFAGVIAHFPEFKPYTIFIRPLGGLICVAGIFLYGGAGVTAVYQAQVDAMKQRIAVAEEKSNSANALLNQKVETKTKVIHDVQIVYKEKIKEVTKTIDKDCKFDDVAKQIINDAAKNPNKDKQ